MAPLTLPGLRGVRASAALVLLCLLAMSVRVQTQALPELTQPVNDFAGVIDPASAQALDALTRSLQQASGDTVVVATVRTFKPFGDIREFAVKLFENHGKGIGTKEKDNGVLVVLALEFVAFRRLLPATAAGRAMINVSSNDGAAVPAAAALAAVDLWKLRSVAACQVLPLPPRWSGNPCFWPDLLRSALALDPLRLDLAKLLGVQLLAADLHPWRASPQRRRG